MRRAVRLDDDARSLLRHAMDRMGISARAHDRVLKLALTIQDLAADGRAAQARPNTGGLRDGKPELLPATAIAEALSYRLADRFLGEGVPQVARGLP